MSRVVHDITGMPAVITLTSRVFTFDNVDSLLNVRNLAVYLSTSCRLLTRHCRTIRVESW